MANDNEDSLARLADRQREKIKKLTAQLDDFVRSLREIAERADSNAKDLDPGEDAHGGFIRIRDDANTAIARAEKP